MAASPVAAAIRTVVVPSFAKLNLSLKVLGRRADGFHELRTVFQTISLADRLEISFRPERSKRDVMVDSSIEIADNLVARAARALMEATGIRGTVECRLSKKIPIGAGLGGGSSNAAAMLLALPVLAGKPVPAAELNSLAAALGSDVPFFLSGGTALGLGRGEELYPLPPAAAKWALVVAPGIHVATPPAFRALARPALTELTPIDWANKMKRFQLMAWGLACAAPEARNWDAFCENDFEAVVFPQHPLLKSLHRKLGQLGASPVRMSGSGSALFGVFPSRQQWAKAAKTLAGLSPEVSVHSIRFISRDQYRAAWRRALGVHLTEATAWPPR